jgi:DNA-directed RNA polymerase specialized sigma24 family protein
MTRHQSKERGRARRRELASYLGRDRLGDLAYRDPDVLECAFEHGYTISQIASAFDVTSGTVRRSMKKHGVESPRSLDEEDCRAVSEGKQKWQARREALREGEL